MATLTDAHNTYEARARAAGVEQVIDRLVRASKDEIIYQAEKAGMGAAAADVAIRGLLAAGVLVDTAGVLHRPVQLVA